VLYSVSRRVAITRREYMDILRLNGKFGLTIIDSDDKCSAGLFLLMVPAPVIAPNVVDGASFIGQSAKCYEKDLPQAR